MDLTLISIVVGLGLTELLLNFHRLVRERRHVTWDALPLAWALVLLVAVVNYWWGIRRVMAAASGWTSGDFIVAMISPIFLYLSCAAALPRAEPGERLDMKAAYAQERTAFLWFILGYSAGNWILDFSGLAGPQPATVMIVRIPATAAVVVALLARSRRWDWLPVVVFGSALVIRLVTQIALGERTSGRGRGRACRRVQNPKADLSVEASAKAEAGMAQMSERYRETGSELYVGAGGREHD